MPEDYQSLALKYTTIAISQWLTFTIVDTFLVLYLLEFLTYRELGIVIAIQLLVGGILDYPTGAFADKFGHGKILFTAYICIIPGGLILIFQRTFYGVIFAFTLIAIGRSQESGALDSYFDNQYNLGSSNFDKENQLFGAFKSRVQTVNYLVAGIAFISGGLVATWIGRRFLIFLHVVFSGITLFLVVKLIGLHKPESDDEEPMNVFSHALSGLRFMFSKSSITLFFIGVSLVFAANGAIWYSQLLFPYYYGYSGSDFMTGVLRSVNFILGTMMVLLVPKMSKKIVNERFWFIVALTYANTFFFLLTYMYYILVPPTQTFILSSFIGVIALFFMIGFGDVLTSILLNRIQLEIVPNKIRNSIYSLFTSLITLLGVPMAILGGWIVTQLGFDYGILSAFLLSGIGIILASIGAYYLDLGKYGSEKLPTKSESI